MAGGMVVHVETFGLAEKFAMFTDTQARRALRSATSRAGVRGKTLVKAKTPVKTGASRAGIRSMSRSSGATAVAKVYASGPHRHITKWQDQGTGPRHKKSTGQYTGVIEPQYMFERASVELDGEVDVLFEVAIDVALARAGLK